jgi:hypothetical protein
VKNDIEKITNEIVAFILATFDEMFLKKIIYIYIWPINGIQNTLYKVIMKKQLHPCGNRWNLK